MQTIDYLLSAVILTEITTFTSTNVKLRKLLRFNLHLTII